LNVLVCNIAERGGQIKTVNVKYSDHTEILPDLNPNKRDLHLDYVNKILGLNLTLDELKKLVLKARMGYEEKDNNTLLVSIPAYRSDDHHEIDMVENISIAYGYDIFEPEIPKIVTVGSEDPFEIFARKLSYYLIGLNHQEVNNFVMTSKEILFEKMNLNPSESSFIEITNPVSSSFEVLRNDLLPLNIDFLSKNSHAALPIDIFEIGEITRINDSNETKTEQIRQLVTLKTDYSISFEDIQSILFSILQYIGLKPELEKLESPIFIKGRSAKIKVNDRIVGDIGEISLKIIDNFELLNPIAAMRLNLTEIYNISKSQ
jgi:phenylalanyl-tRNA synthetase beta chain